MSKSAAKTSSGQAEITRTFGQLKALMPPLGLCFSLWDADGQAIEPLTTTCEFCRLIHEASGQCQNACRALARRITTETQRGSDRSATGCRLLGVPVLKRRRLIGAVVACLPVREMLDEESLALLCDHLKLDLQAVRGAAERSIRHDADDAEDLLGVLDWLVQRAQDRVVANDELATLSTNLATTYEELSLLYRISGSMRVTQQVDEFLQEICNELLEVMNIQASAAVVYAHPPAVEQDMVMIAGRMNLSEEQIKQLAKREIAADFTSDHRAILNNNFRASGDGELGRRVANVVAVPLIAEDELIGMLIGMNKSSGDFDSVDLKLISAVGSQAGVFLANSRLYADLQDLLMGVLHALTATIDAKDPYTCGHSQRVAQISRRLAQECGFSPEKVQQVYLAGLLHDIGKIGVPEATLRKAGRLTDEEYEGMKRHPLIGAKILGGIRQLDDVIVGILHHHERPDGRGYPNGLAGKEVPIEGLIVGLADCFDAMTSDRTYRGALPLEAVIREIRKCSGTQFDEGLVGRFLSLDLEKFMAEIHQPARTVFPLKAYREPK